MLIHSGVGNVMLVCLSQSSSVFDDQEHSLLRGILLIFLISTIHQSKGWYQQVWPHTEVLASASPASVALGFVVSAQMDIQKKQKVLKIPWFKQDVSGVWSWQCVTCFPERIRKLQEDNRMCKCKRILITAKSMCLSLLHRYEMANRQGYSR